MHPGKALVLVLFSSLLAAAAVILTAGLVFGGSDDFGGAPGQGDGLRFQVTFTDEDDNLAQLDEERRELQERLQEDLRDIEEQRRDVEEAFEEDLRDIDERFDEALREQGGQPDAADSAPEPLEPDEPAG